MTRSRYWSNSDFAKKITDTFGGKRKPTAATMSEWDKWHKEAQRQAPFVYWFTEKFLDQVQSWVCYPTDKLSDFRYYLRNRFVDTLE